MNKVKWEITDPGDFGPIRIGMTKTEINAILGDVTALRNHPYPGMAQDIYGKKNVIIDYFEQNEDMRAAFITVSYPFKVIYSGEDIMRMSLTAAKTLLEKNGLRIEKTEVRPQFWADICLPGCLGLNATSETSNHLYLVFMFASDYYEKTEVLLQEYKKNLPQLTEKIFREYGITLPPRKI
jgi:hypothetical protein